MENRVILLKSSEERKGISDNLYHNYKSENERMKHIMTKLKNDKRNLEIMLRLKENNKQKYKCCNLF